MISLISFLSIIIGVVLVLFTSIYIYAKWQYTYWKRQGLPHIEPKFPTGTFDFGRADHIAIVMNERYKKYKSTLKCIGGFIMFSPTVTIYDVDLAKTIMGKDFHYFRNRGAYVNPRDDPLSGHLFNLEGDKWKVMREKLTAVFTSGKMKFMFPTVIKIGQEFVEAIETELKFGNTIDAKEYFARYTTDVIGSCAFGIECNSLKNPEAEFRAMGRKVLKINVAKQLFTFNFQKLARAFKMQLFPSDVTKFFVNAVYDTVKYREENNVQRNDFMDLMIKMRNKEKSNDEKDEDMDGLSMTEIVAQAFVFFLAGFETSSTNMSFTLLELALNPEVQDKARKHVQDILKKHNNQFSYEALQEMHYLEACINESLRKYPPVPFAFRSCSKEYKIPGTEFTVKKGMPVFMPFYSYHHDPDYFEDPEKYDPERFLQGEGNKAPYGFMPFADGPRICIGLRFGMMQSKIGIASLLQNFKFKLSSKTELPIKFNPQIGILQPMDLFLDVEKL